jgi:hypothetical protein
MCPSRAVCRLALAAALSAWPLLAAAQPVLDTDRIDITGRQNLSLGSGARAMGMGGAFLARADDATAASWNPAGLSYLRLPEISLVGVWNSFGVERPTSADVNNPLSDHFEGQNADFAALTWPVAIREVRGAVQLSYQRAISFDGTREIRVFDTSGGVTLSDDGKSSGGFDVIALGTGLRLTRGLVIALGTGLRLTRGLRAGVTVNRWFNGYAQDLARRIDDPQRRLREFALEFRPQGWNFNFGLMWSPVEQLNLAAVYKTPFTAAVQLDKARWDTWISKGSATVTTNSYSSDDVRLDFPSSFGFGISWRAREALTLSADFTQTNWSRARIRGYYDLFRTLPGEEPPPPSFQPERQYPTLAAIPEPGDTEAELSSQHDKQEIRLGVEWVLIAGDWRIPLRAGYLNDRQILPSPSGDSPRFNGFSAGLGIGIRSVLLDVAYVYEYGEYYQTTAAASRGSTGVEPESESVSVRNSLSANRFYASIIYRFSGRP